MSSPQTRPDRAAGAGRAQPFDTANAQPEHVAALRRSVAEDRLRGSAGAPSSGTGRAGSRPSSQLHRLGTHSACQLSPPRSIHRHHSATSCAHSGSIRNTTRPAGDALARGLVGAVSWADTLIITPPRGRYAAVAPQRRRQTLALRVLRFSTGCPDSAARRTCHRTALGAAVPRRRGRSRLSSPLTEGIWCP